MIGAAYKDLEQDFKFLIDELGFSHVEGKDENFMGCSYSIIESKDLRIMFVRERRFYYLEIATMNEPNDWYDFNKFILFCNNNIEINRHINIHAQSKYLKKNYKKIIKRLNGDNYRTTIKLFAKFNKEYCRLAKLDDEKKYKYRFPEQ